MAFVFSLSRPLLVFSLFGALAGGLSAKPRSSLSDFEIEAAEAKVNLDKVIEENQQLREKLTVAEAENAKLSESLAVAQSESEVFRRQTGELKLRLEALGIDAAGGKTSGLQERLIGALNNLRLAETDRKKFADALLSMSESLQRYLKTATSKDAEARLALEAKMRQANELLGSSPGAVEATPVPATLTDGKVISIREELDLVVANIGTRHGVKVGMPFQILRDDKVIGTVRMIDVRDQIAGGLVQNLTSERDKIKIGDRLKVDATGRAQPWVWHADSIFLHSLTSHADQIHLPRCAHFGI